MAKTKVRTKFTPGTVQKVDDAELLDLERQGLIYSRELGEGEQPRKGERAWEPEEPDKPIEEVESGIVTPPETPKKKGASS